MEKESFKTEKPEYKLQLLSINHRDTRKGLYDYYNSNQLIIYDFTLSNYLLKFFQTDNETNSCILKHNGF